MYQLLAIELVVKKGHGLCAVPVGDLADYLFFLCIFFTYPVVPRHRDELIPLLRIAVQDFLDDGEAAVRGDGQVQTH